jgi:predicted transcriptional regulator YdeE
MEKVNSLNFTLKALKHRYSSTEGNDMKYIMSAWKRLENALVDATFAEVGCGTYCTCCNKRCRK